jgi:flagellar hook assembly protein FlgD
LEYNLSAASSVRLRIFNLIGQLVYEKSLQQGETGTAAGVNQISWDGRNGSGTVIGNGGYIAVLQVDRTGERWTRKIAVVK